MLRSYLIGFVMLAASADAFAQTTEVYAIALPQTKVSKSLYNKLTIIDARTDTTSLGIVQLGAFNRKAKVIAKKPLPNQLHDVFNALIAEDAAPHEMLLQLRQFSFAELTGAMSEKGYFYLRASLYAKTGDSYQKVSAIDTMILVSAMDVTNKILKAGSETATKFIAEGLQKQPGSQAAVSYADILNSDELEKQQLKLYTTANYTDGLYLNYRSFADQVPDKQIEVEMKDGYIDAVKTADANSKPKKVKYKDIYAFVYKGAPYVATRNHYYPLKKVGTDLLFTGEAAVNANTGDVLLASAFFGIMGGLIASNASATFEMKIDHLNGGFIRLHEIAAQ